MWSQASDNDMFSIHIYMINKNLEIYIAFIYSSPIALRQYNINMDVPGFQDQPEQVILSVHSSTSSFQRV